MAFQDLLYGFMPGHRQLFHSRGWKEDGNSCQNSCRFGNRKRHRGRDSEIPPMQWPGWPRQKLFHLWVQQSQSAYRKLVGFFENASCPVLDESFSEIERLWLFQWRLPGKACSLVWISLRYVSPSLFLFSLSSSLIPSACVRARSTQRLIAYSLGLHNDFKSSNFNGIYLH